MRYSTPQSKRPTITAEKRRAEFHKLLQRYLRMGFDERESRFKAWEAQTLKL
jgi:hypothetical protein